jgi:hypothetical protein
MLMGHRQWTGSARAVGFGTGTAGRCTLQQAASGEEEDSKKIEERERRAREEEVE